MVDWLGLPLLASEHGGEVDRLILLLHILMIVLFIGWGAFFAYCLIRFRRKNSPRADRTGITSRTSSYVEIAVAAVEAVLLIGFSIPFWMAQVDAMPKPEENAFEVRVVAQQFAWNVHYPGPDGEFGATRVDLVDDVTNPLGLVAEDPAAADDVTSKLLRVPVGRPTLVHLTTKDVIHSFSLPEFRVKQDAIPGMSIPVHFTPTMTTAELREQTGDRARTFEIVCAQLCGLGHYNMKGLLFVETEEAVEAWLAKRRASN